MGLQLEVKFPWFLTVTFLQESHSDNKTFSNWIHDWKDTTISSHGTTHSVGVITHIGKQLEFKLIEKISETNGRYSETWLLRPPK